jgi:hypothetical protein
MTDLRHQSAQACIDLTPGQPVGRALYYQATSLDGKCITSLGEQPGDTGRESALTMREYPVGNQAMPHRGLAPPTTISPAPWGGIGAAY